MNHIWRDYWERDDEPCSCCDTTQPQRANREKTPETCSSCGRRLSPEETKSNELCDECWEKTWKRK